jgi:hypothetical protein
MGVHQGRRYDPAGGTVEPYANGLLKQIEQLTRENAKLRGELIVTQLWNPPAELERAFRDACGWTCLSVPPTEQNPDQAGGQHVPAVNITLVNEFAEASRLPGPDVMEVIAMRPATSFPDRRPISFKLHGTATEQKYPKTAYSRCAYSGVVNVDRAPFERLTEVGAEDLRMTTARANARREVVRGSGTTPFFSSMCHYRQTDRRESCSWTVRSKTGPRRPDRCRGPRRGRGAGGLRGRSWCWGPC